MTNIFIESGTKTSNEYNFLKTLIEQCVGKKEKEDFFRICLVDGKYIFDEKNKIQSRGFYICKKSECIEKLSKHRKYNVETEELLKMLKKGL